jgi:UrcA family protein
MNTATLRRATPLTVLLIGTLVTAGLATTASADSLEPRSITVHFEDLDTNNAHGAAVLYSRIKYAAEEVCGDLARTRSLALLSSYSRCVHTAMGSAIGQVNRPTLTEYAMARRPPSAAAPIKVKVARSG